MVINTRSELVDRVLRVRHAVLNVTASPTRLYSHPFSAVGYSVGQKLIVNKGGRDTGNAISSVWQCPHLGNDLHYWKGGTNGELVSTAAVSVG